MLPILRPISSRGSIPSPVLQEAVTRPPAESPREVGIIRDGIACGVLRAALRIVLVAVVDAVSERVFGYRVHRFAVGTDWEVPDPCCGIGSHHVLIRLVVHAAILDVGVPVCGYRELCVVAIETSNASRATCHGGRGGHGRGRGVCG